MKKSFETTAHLCYCAICVAILVVCSWISIPLGQIPFTLQTYAVFAILLTFGLKLSLWSIIAYIVLGIIGVPVFSNFGGGIGYLLGPTGGFIFGFILTIIISSLFNKATQNKPALKFLSLFIGLLSCYLTGVLWFCVTTTGFTAQGILSALYLCVLPYVIPDATKIILAMATSFKLKPYVNP